MKKLSQNNLLDPETKVSAPKDLIADFKNGTENLFSGSLCYCPLKKGVTLIELIIGVVLIAVISLVVAGYIFQVFNTWSFVSRQKDLSQSASSAIYKIVREIKRCNDNSRITSFNAGQFAFSDIDGNSISYTQSGTNLMRNSDVLCGNLQNPGGLTFTYFDKNGTTTASKDSIAVVREKIITINGTSRFVIESSARLRVRQIQ